MKKCPRCGDLVSEDTRFCPNCGYQFNESATSSAEHHIYDSAEQNDNLAEGARNVNVSNGEEQKQPKSKANKLVITLITVIVILVLIGIGAAYIFIFSPGNNNSATQNSASSSSSSSSASASSSSSVSTSSADNSQSNSTSNVTISADDANDVLGNLFSSVSEDVSDSGNASDIADSFVDGTANSSYQDMNSWVKLQSGNSNVASVNIEVQNLTTRGNVASFQAKYDFEQTGGQPDHIQIYDFTAKMIDNGGELKIQTLAGASKPTSDYDENN